MTDDKSGSKKGQSPTKIVIYSLMSFLIFLIVLGFLNFSLTLYDSHILIEVVTLLNRNIWLIFVFSVIFTIAEVFGSFRFPSNLPAPIFNAVGSLFLLDFIFKVFVLVGRISDIDTFDAISKTFPFLYPIVFLIVLLVGYISILSGPPWESSRKKESNKVDGEERTWEDVGNEFKELLFDAFSSARDSLRQNKK